MPRSTAYRALCITLLAIGLGGCGADDQAPAESSQTVDPAAVQTQTTVQPAAASQPVVAQANSTCTQCHQGKLSFAGRDVAKLAARIREIRDGKLGHPPLALPDTSDAAILALAEALAGN